MQRARRSLLLVCILLSLSFPASVTESASVSELKAAYIYNFIRFIAWPDTSFSSPAAPFQLCIAGDQQLAEALSEVSGHYYDEQHKLKVRNADDLGESSDCQLLYYDDEDMNEWNGWLTQYKGRAVLTLSSNPQFIDRGGMIGFIRKGSRLHFEVNRDALLDSGLTPRASLLEVAERVTGLNRMSK